MEHDEVAALLGISSNTVSRKLQRFVVNSRKYLRRTEEKGGDQPDLVRKSG
jgi:DNA-directed RNA polymerase specialized sigma24 family protein